MAGALARTLGGWCLRFFASSFCAKPALDGPASGLRLVTGLSWAGVPEALGFDLSLSVLGSVHFSRGVPTGSYRQPLTPLTCAKPALGLKSRP